MRKQPIRSRWQLRIAIGLVACVQGCGRVGDPLPPFINIPEAAADFRVEQVAYELRFSWTNPSRNVDQSVSTDVARARIRVGDRVVIEVPTEGAGQSQSVVLPARDLVGVERVYTIVFETRGGRVSAASPPIPLTVVDVPGPGSEVRVRVDQNRIALEWDPPVGAEITDAYRVYRGNAAFPEPPPAETRFEDVRYQEGETYVYTVVPLRRQGTTWIEGLAYDPVTVLAIDRTPPDPPEGLSVMPFEGGAFVRWISSPEVDVVRYIVLRRVDPNGPFLSVSGTGQTTSAFADPDYQLGYVYAVIAVDRSGNQSQPSEPTGE